MLSQLPMPRPLRRKKRHQSPEEFVRDTLHLHSRAARRRRADKEAMKPSGASTYFGDIETSSRILLAQVDRYNEKLLTKAALSGEKVTTVDRESSLRTHVRRYARFYNLDTKYDGRGNLQQPARV